jgi:hypothetical protein
MFHFNVRNSLAIGALAAAGVLVTACGSSGPEADKQATGEQVSTRDEGLAQVSAGEAALKLGVEQWALGKSLLRAFDAKKALVAEFVIDSEAGTIESTLPDAGVRSLQDASISTLSARSAAYLDALRTDLELTLDSSSGVPADKELQNKATYRTYACYRYFADCRVVSTYGTLYGWWRGSECYYPAAECPTNPWRTALRYVPW